MAINYDIRKSAESKDYKDRTLAENMSLSRAGRPDEWLMDEFIRDADNLQAKLKKYEKTLRWIQSKDYDSRLLSKKVSEALKGDKV